mmetsp:Transcript_5691/g.14849  ORF Transcript_5691/g.14849 Transcript_5691/m.14849 type:complete len:223 (-) Transcript_5691:394-1062(-)
MAQSPMANRSPAASWPCTLQQPSTSRRPPRPTGSCSSSTNLTGASPADQTMSPKEMLDPSESCASGNSASPAAVAPSTTRSTATLVRTTMPRRSNKVRACFCSTRSNGPRRLGPASTSVTRTSWVMSGYQRATSDLRKSCSSLTNSQLVGPPPTTTKLRSRRRCSALRPGMSASSNSSRMRFRIWRAWNRCLRKKTCLPSRSATPGIPNVLVLLPTATTSRS